MRKISVLLEVGTEFVIVQGISDLGFKKGVKLVFYVKDPNFEDRRFDGKYVADILKQKVGNGGKLFDITMLKVEPYGEQISSVFITLLVIYHITSLPLFLGVVGIRTLEITVQIRDRNLHTTNQH